jgi:hypothetical protein
MTTKDTLPVHWPTIRSVELANKLVTEQQANPNGWCVNDLARIIDGDMGWKANNDQSSITSTESEIQS